MVGSGINEFGASLHNVIQEENLAWSPSSVYMALSMAVMGAEGNTLKQLSSALHLPGDHTKISEKLKEIQNSLALFQASTEFEFRLANGLFVDKKYPLNAEYVSEVRDTFNSEVKNVEITKRQACVDVNKWVSEKTKDLIKQIIEPTDEPNRRAVLVNAIYLKGQWVKPFEAHKSRTGIFHASSGDVERMFMNNKEANILYFGDDSYQAVFIPYKSSRDISLEMMILLPREGQKGVGFKDFLTEKDAIKKLRERSKREVVDLSIPKFKHETSVSLVEALQKLGVVDAFSDTSADFSKMGPPAEIYISDVLHKTIITVDEAGTEAAAATVVRYCKAVSCARVMSVEFRADRPFSYAIYSNSSDMVLFQGHVDNPMQCCAVK
jgi:serpin B